MSQQENSKVLLWSQRLFNSNALVRQFIDTDTDATHFFLFSGAQSVELFSVNSSCEVTYSQEVLSLVNSVETPSQFYTDSTGRWALSSGVDYWSNRLTPPSRIRRDSCDSEGLLKFEQDWAFELATHLHKDLLSEAAPQIL